MAKKSKKKEPTNATEESLFAPTGELGPGNKNKAVICADVHLRRKPGMWSGRSEIAGDDIFALREIARVCKEEDADLYILGDLLDTVTNLPRPLVIAQEVLGELIQAGHSVRYIQGQHEIVAQAHFQNYPWLSLVHGTAHLHKKRFDFLGHKAFAMDYFPGAYEELAASMVPEDVSVLMLHGTADKVLEFNPHFTVESMFKPNIRLVLAGDYHELIDQEVTDTGARILYPGSAWLQASDETPDKYVYVVEANDDKLSWRAVQLKTRKVIKLSTLDCDVEEEGLPDIEVDSDLPKELQKPVIIVDAPIEKQTYVALASKGHVYSTAKANPEHMVAAFGTAYEAKTDEEVLEQCVDREKYGEQFNFTLDVIQNPVTDATERLRERFGLDTSDLVPVAGSVSSYDDSEVNMEGTDA